MNGKIVGIVFGCIFGFVCLCMGCMAASQVLGRMGAVKNCSDRRHFLTPTTGKQMRDAGNKTYNEGWICDSCNVKTPFGGIDTFMRCNYCELDYCATCKAKLFPLSAQENNENL